jgi:F0F1-type ATP synthase assembly protein I
MPENLPSQQPNPRKRSALTDGVAGAERLIQIAFIMPASLVVGWLIGAGLDKWLHQHWIYIVGLALGFIAGFIEVLRSALSYSKRIDKEDRNG